MTITPEDVAWLREKATPGPWRARDDGVVTGTGLTSKLVSGVFRRWNLKTEVEETAANARFIAAAHDMADLIAEQAKVMAAADALAEAFDGPGNVTDRHHRALHALLAYRAARGQE